MRAHGRVLAESVTPRQPKDRAGQVVRAECTAPCALPRRPGGNLDAVACHRVRRLKPCRISASTSARQYRGFLVSVRTSGSRLRRAQIATAADVTRNRYATCLRVINSSSECHVGYYHRRHYVHLSSSTDRLELASARSPVTVRLLSGRPGQLRKHDRHLPAGRCRRLGDLPPHPGHGTPGHAGIDTAGGDGSGSTRCHRDLTPARAARQPGRRPPGLNNWQDRAPGTPRANSDGTTPITLLPLKEAAALSRSFRVSVR